MGVAFLRFRRTDLGRLREAVRSNRSDDTLARFMPAPAWDTLGAYLTREKVDRGHVLMIEGALDRTLYFIESGMLRVHRGERESETQLALLGPGTVVGEGAFFSHLERAATVQATVPSVLWSLTPQRFDTLSHKHPQTALALTMALGAVVSTRMLHAARKSSIT